MALLRNPTHFPDSYLCGTSHESKPTGPTVGSFLIISVQKKKILLLILPLGGTATPEIIHQELLSNLLSMIKDIVTSQMISFILNYNLV